MPTKQMKIYVQFPTFSNQNEKVKSLINFFMKNASVFFRGSYGDDDKLTSYAGVLRFNNRPIISDSIVYSTYELLIPYHIYFQSDLNFPAFPTLPVSDVSGFYPDLPFVNDDKIPMLDSVLITEMSSLTTVKTEMGLYKGSKQESSNEAVVQFVKENTITLPVLVIPKINEESNTDVRLKPKQIALHQENEDGLYIQKVRIESILDENGNPIPEGFVYDFQLQTDSFTISLEAENNTTRSVYYKAGLCLIDPEVTIENIVENLENSTLHLHKDSSALGNESVQFSIKDSSHESSNLYNFNPNIVSIEQHLGTGNTQGIATKFLAPIESEGTNKAFMYFEMYDATDNEPITEVFDTYETVITDNDVYLTFTDISNQN